MRIAGAGLLLVAMVVAACDSSLIDALVPDPPATVGRGVSVDSILLGPDRRSIQIDFVGGQPPGDVPAVCDTHYVAEAEVVDGVLEVGVNDLLSSDAVTPEPDSNAACPAMRHSRRLVVTLDEPYAGIEWQDRHGSRHWLAEPDTLAAPDDLPAGWQRLASEEIAGTGMWSQAYGLPEAQGRDAPMWLYQAFDEPMTLRWPGREFVEVGGQPATLYRDPEDPGALMVVWKVGDDGFALVADHPDITADDLLTLAASVRQP